MLVVQGYDRLCGEGAKYASLTSEKLLCLADESELPEDRAARGGAGRRHIIIMDCCHESYHECN